MTNQRSDSGTYTFTTPGIQTFDFDKFKKKMEESNEYNYSYVTCGDE